ncbi:MAG: bifunctional salicylyl-CoA 5-hydroxylase/oxidoreductase [Candidatus Eiseniibacteriota bacterium]
MRIASIGGGPAGLYFSILAKKAFPKAEITVYERNKPDDTFGFGVVFSDATMENFAQADRESHKAITDAFAHWDDIDIFFKGQKLTSTGHGFSGMSRQLMLDILQKRCAELDVDLKFQTDIKAADLDRFADYDLVLAADGINSMIRERFSDHFDPQIDFRPNRFVWLGTDYEFPAFTFIFKENEHGMWRVHAYRYMPGYSTFILECTDETFKKSGLTVEDEDATVAYVQKLFDDDIKGHKILKNRSLWRQFPIISCNKWHYKNMVLMGDAVHTAHFSIGSGTKLAMEDSIALAEAVKRHPGNMTAALEAYEVARRPIVDSIQRAARTSLEWFEQTERYYDHLEPIQFGFSLLTRSLRISHSNLKLRDPKYVASIDTWFAGQAANQSGVNVQTDPPPPPMFTPFRLRDMVLPNRVVVSPMCQYSAKDGTINDWHLVHIGSRAVGGAALVMTEMTDVSEEARITPGCAGIYKKEHVAAWQRVVRFVHENSPARIGMQLAHAGRKGSTKLAWEGIDRPLDSGNWPIMAASALPYLEGVSQIPREMTRKDMDKVRDDFVRSATMADEAGFDIIELHMAHGYLLATFVSPLTNQRKDEYGGSLENRMRFPLEVLDAVRKVWPKHKPMSVRLSATDWAEGGVDGAESVRIAALLKAHDVDIVDVSTGQTVAYEKPVFGRLFQTPYADRIRLEVGMPTMTVGAVSSYEDVNSILAAGRADLCVLARAHLYDPYWTRHAAYEQGYTLPWPDPYASLVRYTPRHK